MISGMHPRRRYGHDFSGSDENLPIVLVRFRYSTLAKSSKVTGCLFLLFVSFRTYDQMGVKHEPLTLITPTFEIPLPPLQPAVVPPVFCELPPPQLELFDLDEMLSTPDIRLAQLANRCSDSDLSYFIQEAGEVLGISSMLPLDDRGPKRVLEYALSQVFEYKKQGQVIPYTSQKNFFIQDPDLQAAGLYDVGGLDDEHDDDQEHMVEDAEMFSDLDEYDDI